MNSRLLAIALLALGLAGCDSPQKTADTLGRQIAEFQVKPTPQIQADIEKNFASLEEDVIRLTRKGDPQAEPLHRRLATLRSDYQAAKLAKAFDDTKKAIQGIGEAFKEGAKSVGDALKSTNDTNDD